MIDTIPVLGVPVWPVVKVMFLVALAVYLLFAIVVVRQVQLMTDTLEVGFETPVRLIAIIHLGVAVGVFVLALVIL
jgi:hypothetical protein